MSSGGRRSGAPSRWAITPQLEDIGGGGGNQVQREIEAASTGKIWGSIENRSG